MLPTRNTHTCLPGYRTQLLLAWALGSRATELDVTQRLALEDLLKAFILVMASADFIDQSVSLFAATQLTEHF